MIDKYINNFENIVSSIFFIGFKCVLIILVTLLILSLIMLIIGCLIKSQKIKSKFLKVAPSLLIGVIFILFLPFIFVYCKNIL
jgi:ABC-type Na+ efflux pump permease subunit